MHLTWKEDQMNVCFISKMFDLFVDKSFLSCLLPDSPSPVSPTCDDPVAKRARNRARVIEELIETEKRHVADLTVACKNIQVPLKQQQVMSCLDTVRHVSRLSDGCFCQIDGLDVDTLFGNMEDVIDVSRDFLNCLMENKERGKLGKVICCHAI